MSRCSSASARASVRLAQAGEPSGLAVRQGLRVRTAPSPRTAAPKAWPARSPNLDGERKETSSAAYWNVERLRLRGGTLFDVEFEYGRGRVRSLGCLRRWRNRGTDIIIRVRNCHRRDDGWSTTRHLGRLDNVAAYTEVRLQVAADGIWGSFRGRITISPSLITRVRSPHRRFECEVRLRSRSGK